MPLAATSLGIMSHILERLRLLQAALHAAPSGKPFVLDTGRELSLHFQPHAIQSAMRHRAPDQLIVGYTRTMMSFLLFAPHPERIAMIGLGGGSLAKYIHRHLPAADFTAVEINRDVVALRKLFAIPDDSGRFRVLCLDGADYIEKCDAPLDVLIVDGFDMSGQPPQLSSQAFYDACFAKLTRRGVLVVNLWSATNEYGKCIARLRRSFRDRLLHVPAEDSANRIVFAWKDETFAPSEAFMHRRLRRLSATHKFNFLPVAHAISEVCADRSAKETHATSWPRPPVPQHGGETQW